MKRLITSLLALAALISCIQATYAENSTILTFWTADQCYADFMLERVEEFNKLNPDRKISLDIQIYSPEFIINQIHKSANDSANLPDLADIYQGYLQEFFVDEEHALYLYPLNSLTSDMTDSKQSVLTPYIYGESLFAIPYGAGDMVLAYNKNLAEKYGLSSTDLDTWEHFLAAGRRIRQKDGPYLFPLDLRYNNVFLTMMMQQDASIASDSVSNILASDSLKIILNYFEKCISSDILLIPEEFDIYNYQFFRQFENSECICIIAPVEYLVQLEREIPSISEKISVESIPAWSLENNHVSIPQYGTAIPSGSGNISIAKDFLLFTRENTSSKERLKNTFYYNAGNDISIRATVIPVTSGLFEVSRLFPSLLESAIKPEPTGG